MRYTFCFLIIMLAVLNFPSISFGGAAYYEGVVSRVNLMGGDSSFYVRFSNSELDDCKHQRVYFPLSTLGKDAVNRAYALALISFTTQSTMRIVIDKDINGYDGNCNAQGQIAGLE